VEAPDLGPASSSRRAAPFRCAELSAASSRVSSAPLFLCGSAGLVTLSEAKGSPAEIDRDALPFPCPAFLAACLRLGNTCSQDCTDSTPTRAKIPACGGRAAPLRCAELSAASSRMSVPLCDSRIVQSRFTGSHLLPIIGLRTPARRYLSRTDFCPATGSLQSTAVWLCHASRREPCEKQSARSPTPMR